MRLSKVGMSITKIITASPRGFCAGVERSVAVVRDCIELLGAPIYVKHAIVHNKTVVAELEELGAITVEDVSEIPDEATVVFSAHGSPPEHYTQARERGIRVIDATCPLVTKVHIEMTQYVKQGVNVVYVGHAGHVEGIGVLGEARKFGVEVPLIDNIDNVAQIEFPTDEPLAILTQTTLSIAETERIITAIKEKFVQVLQPNAQDICYATTNRQNAVRRLAEITDIVIIVGSQTSSNSNRLVEVARDAGTPAYLVDSVEEIQDQWLQNAQIIGLSAGASAPEHKVQEIVQKFCANGATQEQLENAQENMKFIEPLELTNLRKK